MHGPPLPRFDSIFRAKVLSAVKNDLSWIVPFKEAETFLNSVEGESSGPKVKELLSSINGDASNKYIVMCLRVLIDSGEKSRILLGHSGDQEDLRKILDGLSVFKQEDLRGVGTKDFLEMIK
jgi:hypothetical protein